MKNQNLADQSDSPLYIIKDDFIDNRNGWELVESEKETAVFTQKGYLLANKDTDRWHHFSLYPEISSLKNLHIKCQLEVDINSGLGQIGLIWGFDKKSNRLNRFCLSAQGKGCSIMHFERDHRPVFHRFYDPFMDVDLSKPVVMEIREANDYWFFRINKKLVYIGHQTHFAGKGGGVGFYLDPGVVARIKGLRVYKRPISKAFSSN